MGTSKAKLNNCSIPLQPSESQARTGGAIHGSRRGCCRDLAQAQIHGTDSCLRFSALTVQETIRRDEKPCGAGCPACPWASRRRRQSRSLGLLRSPFRCSVSA